MKFSIFGSEGFIGTNLINHLKNKELNYESIKISDEKVFKENLGHVIYCIGITSDFRERPFDTVESHVCLLHKILKKCKFDSFLYLSSTRVYLNSKTTNEKNNLQVNPNEFNNLYNISKLMGESLCLASNKPNIRIVRLSNVIGNNHDHKDFLPSIIHDAINKKKILFHMKHSSQKDYVYIDDVIKILPEISIHGKEKIYNVASGINLKIEEIAKILKEKTECDINYADNSFEQSFSKIDITKIKNEFDFNPVSILTKLDDMIIYQKNEL